MMAPWIIAIVSLSGLSDNTINNLQRVENSR